MFNPEPHIPRVIAIIDGTYAYIQKSSNYRVLRQSFSAHKGRHLLKPVMLVAPDGYILDIQGPYYSDSKNNDAALLRNEFERDAERLRHWLQSGDIVIVDRGYRDVQGLLNRLGIHYKMPALVKKGQKQLSCEEANESRLVTKLRWVVEARNGHIKSLCKFLANVISITHLPNLGGIFRIVGAIINRYHPMLNMEGADEQLAQSLLERVGEANVVQAKVEAEKLHTTNAQRWMPLRAELLNDFPILSLDYLRDLTIGVYQVELAPSYVQDKMRREESEEFQVELLRTADRTPEPGFLRVRLYSRFRNATRYQLWIAYKPSNEEDEEENDEGENDEVEQDLIFGYYCTCLSGARTLGPCAHITSVCWFLGYARHQNNVKYPQTVLTSVILDAANRPPQVDNENNDLPEVI